LKIRPGKKKKRWEERKGVRQEKKTQNATSSRWKRGTLSLGPDLKTGYTLGGPRLPGKLLGGIVAETPARRGCEKTQEN